MQKTETFNISVVIPNYNGKNLLQQNLPYLFTALKACGCVYEVIISDDASTDDSVQFIIENYPEIILIQNKRNGGFSININKGVAIAKMQLVLLLNSDIKLSEQYFITQFHFFTHKDTFGVMGQIRNEVDDSIAESCKYPLNSLFKINKFKNIVINSDKSIYTYYLSGANALVNREKLLALKGFNELFSPFYHEDLDLSLRAWENNWKCYYEHKAICWHAVSATINKHNKKRFINIINTRNKLMLHYIHYSGVRLYLWACIMILSLSIRWVINQSFYYQAVRLFFKKLPDIRSYKKDFIAESTSKGQYISFTTVKTNIQKYLNQVIEQINEPVA